VPSKQRLNINKIDAAAILRREGIADHVADIVSNEGGSFGRYGGVPPEERIEAAAEERKGFSADLSRVKASLLIDCVA
jgi:hypothetical protein